MHPTVMRFVWSALSEDDVSGETVIESGSYNVNGTVRKYIESLNPLKYIGTDMLPGPDVDIVCTAENLPEMFGLDSFGVVVSTEMLEHAKDWRSAMAGLIRVLKPGGCLIVTTRSRGFPLHDYPEDYWRYSLKTMREILSSAGLTVIRLESDPTPGVFAEAIKPVDWQWKGIPEAWMSVEVTTATEDPVEVFISERPSAKSTDQDLPVVNFKFSCDSPELPDGSFTLYRNNADGTRTQLEA